MNQYTPDQLAKRESYIANIQFFQIKLNKDKQEYESLQRYKTDALIQLHDQLAMDFKKSGKDTSEGDMKQVYERITKEIDRLKTLDASIYEQNISRQKGVDFLVDLAIFFEDELREAGYEPALLEQMEYFNN